MATLVAISELPRYRHSVKIQARFFKIWDAIGPTNPAVWYRGCVLIDKAGAVISCKIPNEEYQRLSPVLSEGRICEIGPFSIVPSPLTYRTVPGNIMINFTSQTVVTPLSVPDTDIPRYYFDFKRLESVGSDIKDLKKVIDVIGWIAGFGPVKDISKTNQPNYIRTMYIASARGHMVEVTLWSQFLQLFDTAALHEESKTSPVVVICSSLQLNYYEKVYGLKAFSGTKFFFDRSIPELANFAQSLPNNLPPLVLDTNGPPYNGAAANIRQNEIPIAEAQHLTVSAFLALHVDKYSKTPYQCTATIVDLDNRYEWHYKACCKCARKLQNLDTVPECRKCGVQRDDFQHWYKLELQIQDATGIAVVNALGRVATVITGVEVATMVKKKDDAPNGIPDELLAIIGKSFVFTVIPKEHPNYEGIRLNTVARVDPLPPDVTPPIVVAMLNQHDPKHGQGSDSFTTDQTPISSAQPQKNHQEQIALVGASGTVQPSTTKTIPALETTSIFSAADTKNQTPTSCATPQGTQEEQVALESASGTVQQLTTNAAPTLSNTDTFSHPKIHETQTESLATVPLKSVRKRLFQDIQPPIEEGSPDVETDHISPSPSALKIPKRKMTAVVSDGEDEELNFHGADSSSS